MIKFKIFNDLEEEELYLNSMVKKGYIFEKHYLFGVYHFLKREKEKLNIHVDCKVFDNKNEFENYKAIYNDLVLKHISGSTYSGKQYFLSKDNEANLELFSIKESYENFYKYSIQIFWLNIGLIMSYSILILELYGYNGADFSIYNVYIGNWIPLILFTISTIFYIVRIITIHKKYKNKK